jgi:predicted ester cyclase
MGLFQASVSQQQRNKDVFMRLIQEGFSAGNLAVVDEVCATDFVDHQASVQPPNREGVKGLIRYLHQALPDLTVKVEDIAAEGDKVWARLLAQGTHQGVFFGVAPTGKRVEVVLIDICRIEQGKIAEHWGYSDRLAALEQLGAIPRPA